jgi:hypothetical protein
MRVPGKWEGEAYCGEGCGADDAGGGWRADKGGHEAKAEPGIAQEANLQMKMLERKGKWGVE